MDHENTTFTLVHYWLKSRNAWKDEEKQAAFDKILESGVLRFYHMDSKYLLLYALRTPWMQANHHLSHDIIQAVGLTELGGSVRDGLGISRDRSRARTKDSCRFRASVPRDVCFSLHSCGTDKMIAAAVSWVYPMAPPYISRC